MKLKGLIVIYSLFLIVLLVGCSPNSSSDEEYQHIHSYTETILVSPTCEETGEAVYECSCGDNYRNVIKENGHDFGEEIINRSPSCTENGSRTSTCSTCGEQETISVEATGHIYGVWTRIVTPGCESKETERRDCDNCDHYETRDVDATGHDYGSWSVTTEPTEGATGVLTKTCSNDVTHKETFTLPKLSTSNGYAYAVITAANCESTGVGRYTYTKDGQTFNFDVTLEELGHSYGEWSVTTDPTESATGVLTKTCSNDATHKETFTLPKLSTENGYTYSVVTAAKCESTGIGRYTYTKDGQTFNFDVTLEELGHSYGEWRVVANPTTASEGMLEAVCHTDASHIDTFVLPKLSTTNGYTYEIITPATNTTDGLGRYTYIKGTQTFTFDVVIAANTTEFDPR